MGIYRLPLLLALATVLALAGASAAPASRRVVARPLQACGSARWPVKTMADADAGIVDLSPVQTTVEELAALPPPTTRPSNNRAAPVELTTYTVTVNLVETLRAPDLDFHLIVADPDTGRTMITEFPDAVNCEPNTDPALVAQMQSAREAFIDAFGVPPSDRFLPISGTASLTGVGFFDEPRGQRGEAPNGIELHPILSFQLNQPAAPTP